MIIATYNVNSVNARLDNLSDWIKKNNPDVLMLQEIKSEFNTFPFFELKTLGYDVRILGQKSYNGVALLSRHKLEITAEGLPGFEDENARYLEASLRIDNKDFRVASVYLPNGNPPYNNPDDKSKYLYKLQWMEALYKRAQQLLSLRVPTILGGDFNVILRDDDVYDPEAFRHNALATDEVRDRLKAIEYLGFYDAFRTLHPKKNGYTFWDYSGGAFQNDNGMRIDYLFLSPDAVDLLQSCEVDKAPRAGIKPSDHTVLKAVLK